jgi:hypothetical protein
MLDTDGQLLKAVNCSLPSLSKVKGVPSPSYRWRLRDPQKRKNSSAKANLQ